MPDVGKLRQVLDYWSCEQCLDVFTPEQDYLCGVCARLNREVTIRRTAVGSDEAVQVIPPEDFTMAKSLRDRIQVQELELQDARGRLKKLSNREAELLAQLTELRETLEETKREKDEAALVPFELVGVKEEAPEEELMEFEAETPPEPEPASAPDASQWEVVPEEVPLEPAPEEPAAFEPSPEPEPFAPPRPSTGKLQATDDAIARIEGEIAKIEAELTELADQERALVSKGRAAAQQKKTRRRK